MTAEQEITTPDAVETQPTETLVEPPAPALSAAHKAFDLFDAGKLGEAALLVALGVSREGYALDDDLRMRALTALEQGRLDHAEDVREGVMRRDRMLQLQEVPEKML
ncbi:hypothetical protein ACFTOW_02005, partial [Lacimonas salitolerans]